MSSRRRSFSAARLKRAVDRHSFARRGETKNSPVISAMACRSVMPASSICVTSRAGRMPVRAPQGGCSPVMAVAALKKLSFTMRWHIRSRENASASSFLRPTRLTPTALRPQRRKRVTAVV